MGMACSRQDEPSSVTEDPEATGAQPRLGPGLRGQDGITLMTWHFKNPREIPQSPPWQPMRLVLSLSPFYNWGN